MLKLHERNPRRRPPPKIESIVPTPLEAETRREPIPIDPITPRSQTRALWLIWEVARFLVRRFYLRLTGRLDDQQHAKMARELFERLGGMWIKLGQLLSLRSDLMSDAMCRELASLQYQMRGFPPKLAVAVIEEDLGRPISAVFAHFETEPFAAASIAQVHRATLLRNNRGVVVKVMRPDVSRSFARDLRLLSGMAWLLGRLRLMQRFRLKDAIGELRAVLEEEVSYERENVNLRRMRKNLRAHGIYAPKIYKDLSSRRVLVMEEIPGVLMSQYIRMRRDDPDRVHRWAVLNGIEAEDVAKRLAITVLRQILEDNEFHGDLHPGNIVLLADNHIALIDFGSVGRLSQRTWMIYRHSLAALADRDYERAADLMIMMSPSMPTANHRRLQLDMTRALQRWEFNRQVASATYADRSLAAMSNEVARVMADHDMPLTWSLMRVGRTFSTLDASLQTLVPDADFVKLIRSYFRDLQRRRSTPRGRAKSIHATMHRLSAWGGDLQILLDTGVRLQALRLHGLLDRASRAKLTALVFLSRLASLAVGVTAISFLIDEALHRLYGDDPTVITLHRFLSEAVPDLHPLQWVLLLVTAVLLNRLVRATRASLQIPE